MSHYTVAVFANHSDDFDELLAPYDENNEAFFTFHPVDEADLRRDFEACQKDWDFETWLTHNQYCRDEDGQVGYMCNPDAKWDYYNLDARNHEFGLKPGVWDPDELHYRKISTPMSILISMQRSPQPSGKITSSTARM